MVQRTRFTAKHVGKTVCGRHAFEQALTAIGLQHAGGVFQQITVEVAHHQHVWLALRFECGNKVLQRIGLLGTTQIKAALTGINITRRRAAAFTFKVVDDKPEVTAIVAAGKALRQWWATGNGDVIGEVCARRQYRAAHPVNCGGLVQNIYLDGVCADGAAVDCRIGASTCPRVKRADQLLRGNVGVLYLHQPQHIRIQAQNRLDNFCLLAFKFNQVVSAPAVAGSDCFAAQRAALTGLACGVLPVGKCSEVIQHIQAGNLQCAANIWWGGFSRVGVNKQRRGSRVNAVSRKAVTEHPRHLLRGVAHAAYACRARRAEVRRRVWVLHA